MGQFRDLCIGFLNSRESAPEGLLTLRMTNRAANRGMMLMAVSLRLIDLPMTTSEGIHDEPIDEEHEAKARRHV